MRNRRASARARTAVDVKQQSTDAGGPSSQARPLEQIAQAIDLQLQSMVTPYMNCIDQAVAVGSLLIEAKAKLGHGKFMKWRAKHWPDLSKSTASDCMLLARTSPNDVFRAMEKVRPGGHFSIKGVLQVLRDPAHKNAKANKDRRAAVKKAAASASGNSALVENAVVLSADSAPEELRSESPPEPRQASIPALSNRRARPNREPAVDYQRQNGTLESTPLPMSGQGERNGSRQTHGASAVAEEKPDADPEDQLSAADWLDTLPLHRALFNPTSFDEEALLWRNTRELVAALKAAVAPTPKVSRSIPGRQRQQSSFRSLIAVVAATRHPRHWMSCMCCHGTGEDQLPGGPCQTSQGAGYEVTNELDEMRAEASEPVDLT